MARKRHGLAGSVLISEVYFTLRWGLVATAVLLKMFMFRETSLVSDLPEWIRVWFFMMILDYRWKGRWEGTEW